MNEKEKPLDKEQLQYAHRFAAEQFTHENRAFWTRVTALMLGNSFLVAGFAGLHGSNVNGTPLLLTIAASGIAIQALWPVFAVHSYPIFKRWGKDKVDIGQYLLLEYCPEKERLDKEQIVEKGRAAFEDVFESSSESPKIRKSCLDLCKVLLRLLWDLHPGAVASVLLFTIFLAIWIDGACIVDTSLKCHLLAILVPVGLNIIVILIVILRTFKSLSKMEVK